MYKPLSRGLFFLSPFVYFLFPQPKHLVGAWHIVGTLNIYEENAARGLPISITEGQAELKVPQAVKNETDGW